MKREKKAIIEKAIQDAKTQGIISAENLTDIEIFDDYDDDLSDIERISRTIDFVSNSFFSPTEIETDYFLSSEVINSLRAIFGEDKNYSDFLDYVAGFCRENDLYEIAEASFFKRKEEILQNLNEEFEAIQD